MSISVVGITVDNFPHYHNPLPVRHKDPYVCTHAYTHTHTHTMHKGLKGERGPFVGFPFKELLCFFCFVLFFSSSQTAHTKVDSGFCHDLDSIPQKFRVVKI